MTRARIAVGLDGSAAARNALAWAVREATRRRAAVLVVTAWPNADRAAARESGTLVAGRLRLSDMQRDAIATATAGIDPPPPIAREVIFADPVLALCHAATFADLLVLGGDETIDRSPWSIAAHVGHRTGAHRPAGIPVPIILVPESRTRPIGSGMNNRSTVASPGRGR